MKFPFLLLLLIVLAPKFSLLPTVRLKLSFDLLVVELQGFSPS